jgi:hypothetical protein
VLPDIDLNPLRTRGQKLDIVMLFALLLMAACSNWWLTGSGAHIQILTDPRADDVWFEADVVRVIDDMSHRGANHYRTTVHPLFPMLTYPIVHAGQKLFHTDELHSIRGMIAGVAGVWIAALFFLLRLLRCRRVDAVLFTLLATATSAALYWTAIPETYEFGSLTVLVVLIVAAFAERHGAVPTTVDIAAGAASMSILVTDFMVNVASLVSRYRLGQAFQLACNALVVVVLLWAVQKYFFHSAQFFLGTPDKGAPPDSKAAALMVIFFHSFVAPDIVSILGHERPDGWPQLSFQHTSFGSMGFIKVMALASWSCLLVFAVWALARLPQHPRFRMTLALSIAGQIVLHLVYGGETFLYALDWMPLFIVAAALATLTPWRGVVLLVAAVFAVTAGIHNISQLQIAMDTVVADGKSATHQVATHDIGGQRM